MRKYILIIFLLLSYSMSNAQCNQFDALIRTADKLSIQGDYEEAVKKYAAAMVICPDRSEEAGQKIVAVFKRIDALKKQAINDKKRAELSEQKAKMQAIISKTLVMASTARDWAREGLYTEALALLEAAYDTAKINNVHPPTPVQAALASIYYDEKRTYPKVKYNLHTDKVLSVAFSPDGKNIITGSEDNTAILWDLQGKQMQTFKGHTDLVYSVAFSPDGQHILTGSSEGIGKPGTAILWDLQGKQIQTLKGHTSAVTSVAFSPDGKNIITGGSEDKTAILWDLQGKQIQTFKEGYGDVTSVAFSPDGKSIITGSDNDITIRLHYTPKGIKHLVNVFSWLMPEKQDEAGLAVQTTPQADDVVPWVLWSHAEYWEEKGEYQKAQKFYQRYEELYPIDHAREALERVDEALKEKAGE